MQQKFGFYKWLAGFVLACVHLYGWAQAMHDKTAGLRPQLATGVAIAPDGQLWMVGLASNGKLFVQHKPLDTQAAFSNPQWLDTGNDQISADGENRPKIAFGPKGWVVISYTQPLAKPYTGFIRMLRSNDGGKTFSAPFTVHQDRQEITHRFESIAFDAKGALHTVWIDKRDQPPRNSGKSYPGAAIYRNVSLDGGATFTADTKVADHSCECCRIALAPHPAGDVFAMWRHVFGEQTRDHAFTNITHSAPNEISRSSHDNWQINACPHHGPGLALNTTEAEQGFHAVWFGIRQDNGVSQAGVRYAQLNARGEPVASSVRLIPDVRAEHADVMSFGRRVVIVWRSSEGQKSKLMTWRSNDAGKTFELKTIAETLGHNDHPRTAQSGEKMFVVWRLPTETKVYDLGY